ncbi:MAG: hypothetical protein ACTMIA_14745 [Vibrio sp.]
MKSLLIGLMGAIVGVLFGHYMTVKLANRKASLQEQAFYFEFEIWLNKYKNDFTHKLDDFNEPIKCRYVTSVPVIDMSLVNALAVELAGTGKVIHNEVRTLMLHTSKLADNLVDTAARREKFNDVGNQNTRAYLDLTKQMLIDEVQLIFYLYKLVEDRSNFRFGGYKYLEMAEGACKVANISFDPELWEDIMPSCN